VDEAKLQREARYDGLWLIFYTSILYPSIFEEVTKTRIGVWHYILLMALNFSSGF